MTMKIENRNIDLYSLFVIKAGIHKMNYRITNREYPDHSLIWIYPVCQGLFNPGGGVLSFFFHT